MGEFKFRCPYCKQKLKITEETLGQSIECPACKGSIKIPVVLSEARACPECGATVDKYVTICGGCLYDFKTKRKITEKNPEAAPSFKSQPRAEMPQKTAKPLKFS